MKPRLILALLVATVALGGGDPGLAQSQNLGIFWAPNPSRSVTISRNGVPLTSFRFPAGTFLSASYDQAKPNTMAPGRWEFGGDVVLRAQPAIDAPGQGPNRPPEEIMSQPPLVLTLKNVRVLVENLQP